MAMIIGVRFREVGRVYFFDPGEHQVKKGERVIVETARGMECGEVVQENADVPEEQVKRPLKAMIRVATEEDLLVLESKTQKEEEAFRICEEKILKHGLDMKLVNVEYTFDASKIIFHFTADQRVDFRALVRDLAGVFRTRIELRQIGVRDEAKLLGGLGVCGRPFCCNLFMGDFHPVSIKMAKEQGLSLNPSKISGSCGRLMCCLKYEEAAYEDALKHLPSVGSSIETPDGRGTVTEVNAVSRNIKVKLERKPEAPPQSFLYSETEGAQRRASPMIDPMPELVLPEEPKPRSRQRPPAPRQEMKRDPKPAPKQEKKNGSARQETKTAQKPGQKPQQKPKQESRQAPAPKQAQKQQERERKPAPPRKKPLKEEGEGRQGGGNWRERHPQRKSDTPPAYRQEQPRRAAPPPAARKAAAPGEKPPPRYSEIPAPRRANAPAQARGQQTPLGGANYRRQPWQKKEGQKGKGKGESKAESSGET